MAPSITGIELRYSKRLGPVGLFKVTYELLGQTFTRESYVKEGKDEKQKNGDTLKKVILMQPSSLTCNVGVLLF